MRWASRTIVAAVLSGVPSTVHALLTGRDPLAATRAAATLIPRFPPAGHDSSQQEFARGTPLISRYQGGLTVLRGVAVHLAVSAFWAAVIEAADSRARAGTARGGDPVGIGFAHSLLSEAIGERKLALLRGAVAGLMIAALDLEIIGRCHPAVRKLPRVPQWLDHVAFGALVTGLAGSGGSASSPTGPQ